MTGEAVSPDDEARDLAAAGRRIDAVDVLCRAADSSSAALAAGYLARAMALVEPTDQALRLALWQRYLGVSGAATRDGDLRLADLAPTFAPRGPRFADARCPRCLVPKPAPWLRCGACDYLPDTREELALAHLLSRRFMSDADFDRLTAGAVTESGPSALLTAACASRLYEPQSHLQSSPIHDERSPGTVVALVHEGRQAAALLEMACTTEATAHRPPFLDLAHRVCVGLLDDASSGTLSANLTAQQLDDERRLLEHRCGERLRVLREHRVQTTPQGVVGAFEIGHGITAQRRLHLVRRDRCTIAAVVALEGDRPCSHLTEVTDLATQLAEHVAVVLPLPLVDEKTLTVAEDRTRSVASYLRDPFLLDPFVTVEEAIQVVSDLTGVHLHLNRCLRFERPQSPEPGPLHFPGESAMRAG